MRRFFALLFSCAAATAQLRAGGSGSAIYLLNTQGAHVPGFHLPERFVTTETWIKLAPVRSALQCPCYFACSTSTDGNLVCPACAKYSYMFLCQSVLKVWGHQLCATSTGCLSLAFCRFSSFQFIVKQSRHNVSLCRHLAAPQLNHMYGHTLFMIRAAGHCNTTSSLQRT